VLVLLHGEGSGLLLREVGSLLLVVELLQVLEMLLLLLELPLRLVVHVERTRRLVLATKRVLETVAALSTMVVLTMTKGKLRAIKIRSRRTAEAGHGGEGEAKGEDVARLSASALLASPRRYPRRCAAHAIEAMKACLSSAGEGSKQRAGEPRGRKAERRIGEST